MGLLRADLDFTPFDQIIREGLHAYLDALQSKVNDIDSAIVADFVARSSQARTQAQAQS